MSLQERNRPIGTAALSRSPALITLLLFSSNSLASGPILKPQVSAHYPEVNDVIGDTPALLQSEPGFYLNLFTNDVFGHTDKLNTHSFGGAYQGKANEVTLRTAWHWRLITPIHKANRYARPFQTPVGRFADWMEIKQAAAWTRNGRIMEGFFGVSHMGPKGGGEVQNYLHATWGLNHKYSWENPVRQVTWSGGFAVGFADALHTSEETYIWRATAGYSQNFLVEEVALRGRVEWLPRRSKESFTIAGSFQVSKLLSSQLAEVKPYRAELAMRLQIFRVWQPAIRITTPFLASDFSLQIHGSPLDFHLTW